MLKRCNLVVLLLFVNLFLTVSYAGKDQKRLKPEEVLENDAEASPPRALPEKRIKIDREAVKSAVRGADFNAVYDAIAKPGFEDLLRLCSQSIYNSGFSGKYFFWYAYEATKRWMEEIGKLLDGKERGSPDFNELVEKSIILSFNLGFVGAKGGTALFKKIIAPYLVESGQNREIIKRTIMQYLVNTYKNIEVVQGYETIGDCVYSYLSHNYNVRVDLL